MSTDPKMKNAAHLQMNFELLCVIFTYLYDEMHTFGYGLVSNFKKYMEQKMFWFFVFDIIFLQKQIKKCKRIITMEIIFKSSST